MKKPDSLLTLDDKEAIAYALYAAGFEPTTSTDFCNTIIRGYGNGNSYFEYQLVCDENNKVIPWEIVKAAQQRMQQEEQAFDIEHGLPLYVVREGHIYKYKDGYYTVGLSYGGEFVMFDRENKFALFVGNSATNSKAVWNDALLLKTVTLVNPYT